MRRKQLVDYFADDTVLEIEKKRSDSATEFVRVHVGKKLEVNVAKSKSSVMIMVELQELATLQMNRWNNVGGGECDLIFMFSSLRTWQ